MPSGSLSQLACLGGTPRFAESFFVGRPNIGDHSAFLKRAADILERRWLSNHGVCVQEFEKRLCDMLGVRHCIAMCNATVALEITSRALGLRSEVIVPSFTFVATAHALQWQEITPVFCDIDPATHNIDPAKVEALITPRTTGIVGVHLWGRPCNVEALQAIADKHGLRLMFDAAHAFGCSHRGKMIGGFGEAEVFSFHATKFLNTFEGGAVATNDDALAERIKLMHNFGFSGFDNVVHIGTNGKMNEMSAAMGLTGLDSIDTFISANRSHWETCQHELAGVSGISVINYNTDERCNFQYLILEVDDDFGLSRDHLLAVLHAENVIARRYFYPGTHRMQPYRSLQPQSHLWLPETEKVCQRILSLPTGTAVTEEDIRAFCSIIRAAQQHAEEIKAHLATAI